MIKGVGILLHSSTKLSYFSNILVAKINPPQPFHPWYLEIVFEYVEMKLCPYVIGHKSLGLHTVQQSYFLLFYVLKLNGWFDGELRRAIKIISNCKFRDSYHLCSWLPLISCAFFINLTRAFSQPPFCASSQIQYMESGLLIQSYYGNTRNLFPLLTLSPALNFMYAKIRRLLTGWTLEKLENSVKIPRNLPFFQNAHNA